MISQIILGVIIGVFLWTLMEYILHRFVFHLDDNLPNHNFAFLLHYLLHGIHHAFPMDRMRLVFPPTAAIPIVIGFNALYSSLFFEFWNAFLAGTILGYIGYDLTHYFIHHHNPPTPYYKFLKRYHIFHHYKNPNLGYGVSNPLWDFVFDTVLFEGFVNKPEEQGKKLASNHY